MAKQTSKRGPAPGAARWTDEQKQMLLDAVKRAPTAKVAFEDVARKLGKNVGTVQAQYYGLQRKAGKGTTTQGGRPRKAAPVTVSFSSAYSKGALGKLDVTELVTLIENARAILATRKSDLAEREKAEKAAIEAKYKAERAAVERALKSL
jgi:hypothetical protein